MNSTFFRMLAVLALCFLAVPDQFARAQLVGIDFEPPLANTYRTYLGTGTWQRPDGSSLRGTAVVTIIDTLSMHGQPNSLLLYAKFEFGAAGSPFYYSYLFRGKMDPNGRGFLRYEFDAANAYPLPLPTLDPGKVPVLLTNGTKTLIGGVLADDGSQLTLRVEYSVTNVEAVL